MRAQLDAYSLLTNVGHEMFELTGFNCSTTIFVQRPEGEPHHLLVVRLAHLVGHHVAELGELYLARTVSIILTVEELRTFLL